MRLVADTNVLMTAFWSASIFSGLAARADITLYAPAYALKELKEHEDEIRGKTKATAHEFAGKMESLKAHVRFFDKKEYSAGLRKMGKELRKLDLKDALQIREDIDFLTLAHVRKCALWSNDSLLKKQKIVDVFSTRELIQLLGPEQKS